MTLHELLQSLGINPAVLVAGGFGGVLRALSRKQLKVREVILSPICGSLAAAYLTLPTVHYIQAVGWPIPKMRRKWCWLRLSSLAPVRCGSVTCCSKLSRGGSSRPIRRPDYSLHYQVLAPRWPSGWRGFFCVLGCCPKFYKFNVKICTPECISRNFNGALSVLLSRASQRRAPSP